MLWRACRGNVFLRQAMIESPLEDPSNVSDIIKHVKYLHFHDMTIQQRHPPDILLTSFVRYKLIPF